MTKHVSRHTTGITKILIPTLGMLLLAIGLYSLVPLDKKDAVTRDHKNIAYTIDGKSILLENGYSSLEVAPGSSSKIITRYFGNEARKDINGDGKEDIIFLVTQETGGSGIFYYVVGALTTPDGYTGSSALFLGDRIAPQSTVSSTGKTFTITYAERNPGESFATSPSLGKSITLLLDPATKDFGEVIQNFEGEADPSLMKLPMKTWGLVKASYNNDAEIIPFKEKVFSLTFTEDGRFSATTDCNRVFGSYLTRQSALTFTEIASTKMFCEGSQEGLFIQLLQDTVTYTFTSRGELILDLKEASGNVIFK